MKLKSLLLFLILIVSLSSAAKVKYVRAMFNTDASSQITIGWNQESGEEVLFQYDSIIPKDFNFSFTKKIDKKVYSKGMHNYFVRLKNLKPNTKYYFVIKDSEGFSKVFHFSTVSDSPEKRLSFIAGGDSRDNSEVRRKANLLVAKLCPHAVFFNGDFTGLGLEKQWLEWFDDWELTIPENGRISPLVVTRGNHELTNKIMLDLFDVPNRRVVYNTVFGGTLLNLVSLNSETYKKGRQKLFLRNTLRTHANYTWQIMQYHRPVRPHVASKKEMETQYRHFVPLFEKYENVKLCLENDSHTCKSTWPIVQSKAAGSEEGFVRNDEKGIIYVGEGCWGAPLREPDDNKCWTRNSAMINHFNWIFVSKDKIEVRTIKYENSAIVESLTEETRFQIPQNVDIWDPSNGAVIEIIKKGQ